MKRYLTSIHLQFSSLVQARHPGELVAEGDRLREEGNVRAHCSI